MNMKMVCAVAAFLAVSASVGVASAADFKVLMLNKGSDGKTLGFSPSFLQVEPGDTVTFIPVDKSHNAETILDMIPAAAATWKGKTDEQIAVTLTEPGLYGFKCYPHFSMGMVGLIQVGNDRSNLTELMNVRLPSKAQARMMELFAKPLPDPSAAAVSPAQPGRNVLVGSTLSKIPNTAFCERSIRCGLRSTAIIRFAC